MCFKIKESMADKNNEAVKYNFIILLDLSRENNIITVKIAMLPKYMKFVAILTEINFIVFKRVNSADSRLECMPMAEASGCEIPYIIYVAKDHNKNTKRGISR